MKNTDLRITNLVKYPSWNRDGSDAIFMIRDIYYDQEKISLTNGRIQTTTDFEMIKPIETNRDDLLKMGFVWTDFDSEEPSFLAYKKGTKGFLFSDDSNNFRTVVFQHPVLGNIELEYLHEVQNLLIDLKITI